MRTPSTRIPLLAAVLFALCLGACGGGASHRAASHPEASHREAPWGDAVARVGRYTLAKSELDRWSRIEAILTYTYKPSVPVPPGVIPEPPLYTACVHLALQTLPRGEHRTQAALRRQCAAQYTAIQQHILEIIITNDWFHEEARRLGVSVPRAEVDGMVAGEFSSRARFERYLRLTGEREADYQWIVESELLIIKMQKLAGAKPGLTEAQSIQARDGFGGTVTARWTPRTRCRPGYLIGVCGNFKPAASQP